MHIVNLLEQPPPEIISIILKNLPEQNLKILADQGNYTRISHGNTFEVLLDGLQVLALDEIVERLNPE
ncbi:hypothetical protein RhiirA4_451632 [Rhizophagus irregularis]|uniref:Uncharacterized protein n=1 Tax=Rhizophagus irregularis TaxID=588596 RepID=A0A2I1FW67_9GLOM|nr:hypothetical protein RhiirA4_451632 [Rhizophagus irregularis]